MIKVILMDIGNVLLDFDIRKLMAEVVTSSGKTHQEALGFLIKSGVFEKYEKGLVTSPELFEAVAGALQYKGSFETFRVSWNDIFTQNAGGVEAFHALKKSHRVVLASNTNEMHFDHIEAAYPFIKAADDAVLSHRIKARKPEADFYAKALAQTGVPASEALLIDDLLENIAGAEAAGIRGVRYTGIGPLRDGLKLHGIMV